MPDTIEAQQDDRAVYRISAGLLSRDAALLPLLYAALVLPTLLVYWHPLSGTRQLYSFIVFRLLVTLSVFFFAANRWLRRLSLERPPLHLRSYLLSLGCGMLVWLPVILLSNILFSTVGPGRMLQLLSLALLLPAFWFLFRHFFFFIPAALNVASLPVLMRIARNYNKHSRWLPLRVMAAPFALECLVMSIVQIPAPDGRLLWVNWLAMLSGGIFWLLTCYNGLAFGLCYMDDPCWREHRLDPYRQGRLDTIAVCGGRWPAALLKPGNGIKMLLVAVLIGLANIAVFLQTPPSAEFTVETIKIRRNLVSLSMVLSDEKYHFRGFYPYYLRLAGEKGEEVASFPKRVYLDGKPLTPADLKPLEREDPLHLKVLFETNRNKDSLKDLEDLHLWYLASPILRLDMQAAVAK